MTEIINPSEIFSTQLVTGFYGILLIMIEVVYLVFAFLLTRQIKLMNRSFKTPTSSVFRFLGAMHMFASFVVLIVTIIAL